MESVVVGHCSATREPSGMVVVIAGREYLDEVCGARLSDAMAQRGIDPRTAGFVQLRAAAAAAGGAHACRIVVPLHPGRHRCRCGLEW
jgi:hypothetical protein